MLNSLLQLGFALGFIAFLAGLVGLAAGRLDGAVFNNRRRLALLAIGGLVLLFVGSAPPVRATPDTTFAPDTVPHLPLRAHMQQLHMRGVVFATPVGEVGDEQREAYEAWEARLLTSYEDAEKAGGDVPAVMEALAARRLDRFSAWVHLARISQDVKQANLTLYDVSPPGGLLPDTTRRLEEALTHLHDSLAHKRAAIVHLQRHVRAPSATHLEEAARAERLGAEQQEKGVLLLLHARNELRIVPEEPAASPVDAKPR